MTLLESIIGSYLISESASADEINGAIDGMHPAKIKYDSDDKGEATGYRHIYPVAYGLTKAGNPVVRAYQVGGDTTSVKPGWKFFRTDRIISWKTLSRKFSPNEYGIGGAFQQMNKDGDNSMSQVYNISPIGNAKAVKDNMAKSGTIKQGPITKKDVENAGIKPNIPVNSKDSYTPEDAVNDIISKIGSEKNVDNYGENDYNTKEAGRMTAPETRPIMKSQVVGKNSDAEEESGSGRKMESGNEPITKGDVKNGGEEHENNELADKYNDMLARIDRLNNNEEEEEENNG